MPAVRGLNLMLTETAAGVQGTLMALAINADGTTEDVAEFDITEGPSEAFELRDAWMVEMLAIAAEQSNNPLPQRWVDTENKQLGLAIRRLQASADAVQAWVSSNGSGGDVYSLLGTLLGSAKVLLLEFDRM